MALTNLPSELLDMIVEFSLPEIFKSLATICWKIYERCTPFINRHNELRSRFRDFGYYAHAYDSVVAASDLISLIAADPCVARYIRTADLRGDSTFLRHLLTRGKPPKSVPSIEDGGVIVQLFANSTPLRRAGLDWREYYSVFAEDVREMRFSQHGCAFLLTLLGQVEWLRLPGTGKPNAETNELLDFLSKEAQQHGFSSSGLRSVKTFIGSLSTSETEYQGLSWTSPFLALPHLKVFSISGSFAVRENPRTFPFRRSSHIVSTLEAAHLSGCCIYDTGISAFLKHTPRLKTLSYSHSIEHDYLPLDWDICNFINAVAREAGSHLVELSVSTRPFQKLKRFEFPQEVLMCNINSTGVAGNIATSLQYLFNGGSLDPFVRDLIPPSVTHLWLTSKGMGPYDIGLDTLFRHFRSVRRSQLPHLQHVYIDCEQGAVNAYKQQCNKIVVEGDREGVVIHLNVHGSSGGIEWNSSPYIVSQRL
ncbi:hypothetical protein BU23DRAFT_603049 [Bimuria novae-zelandiae CBS 107.79]|uniref:F-box domain-containing protein n=1 Tax=Bimuria novae-zelandiae CBS 107.79 TaxID=1447943 RepID=A0A6A5UR23_9PLEO|nr:hypothetical protein BU23DRAFT_603049 [Bimuria novae-zelandiae CBS 107.79]